MVARQGLGRRVVFCAFGSRRFFGVRQPHRAWRAYVPVRGRVDLRAVLRGNGAVASRYKNPLPGQHHSRGKSFLPALRALRPVAFLIWVYSAPARYTGGLARAVCVAGMPGRMGQMKPGRFPRLAPAGFLSLHKGQSKRGEMQNSA